MTRATGFRYSTVKQRVAFLGKTFPAILVLFSGVTPFAVGRIGSLPAFDLL